jgi:hypothetical protein
MQLNKLIRNDIPQLYSNYDFLNDTMLYADNYKFKRRDTITTVDPMDAYVYQGNLFGLFTHIGIAPEWHLLTMYYNDMQSPVEYDGEKLVFYVPTEDIYSRMYNLN